MNEIYIVNCLVIYWMYYGLLDYVSNDYLYFVYMVNVAPWDA